MKELNRFVELFTRLREITDNRPKLLLKRAEADVELQDLAHEINSVGIQIRRHMAKNPIKALHNVPKGFFGAWKDYCGYFGKAISKASSPALMRDFEESLELVKLIERQALEAGEDPDEAWERHLRQEGREPQFLRFDPSDQRASEEIESCLSTVHGILENNEFSPEVFGSVLGAWDFLTETIGLDVDAIQSRWMAAPELLLRGRVGEPKTHELVLLYNEAVRCFVFGCRLASIAMARAIMEQTLVIGLGRAEETMQQKIEAAERDKHALKRLRLSKWNRFANEILHEYTSKMTVSDTETIECLKAIRELVLVAGR